MYRVLCEGAMADELQWLYAGLLQILVRTLSRTAHSGKQCGDYEALLHADRRFLHLLG